MMHGKTFMWATAFVAVPPRPPPGYYFPARASKISFTS